MEAMHPKIKAYAVFKLVNPADASVGQSLQTCAVKANFIQTHRTIFHLKF